MNAKNSLNNGLYKKNMIISLMFYVAIVAVNYLSAIGFINGNSQSDVSRNFPTMITPAGFAFSIWGVIYLFIFIAIISPLFKKSESSIKSLNSISTLFWISAVINIAWTFVFAYEIIWLSAILIVALLINVFMIMKKTKEISGSKISFFDIGFGLYAGWLSIASVVNFMAFLGSIQFNFFNNPELFYCIVLSAFVAIIALLQRLHKNPVYVLSIAWAFFGIIVKLQFQSYMNPLFLVLLIGIVILLAVDLIVTIRKNA